MPNKVLKVPANLTRAASMMVAEGDKREVRMSISSDVPYERYDYWNDERYYEVLDHAPGGIDDERLKAGLPILFNHNREKHLGRGTSFECDGHKCDVVVKFSESEFAEEKFKDVKAGILVDTSVGYELLGEGICIGAKDELPVYKFRFKVFEASLVTIPADSSVGVGRQRDNKPTELPKEISIRSKETIDEPNSLAQKQPANPNSMTPEELAAKEKAEAIANAKLRAEAIAEHKAKCKKIDEFVGALKNPAWQKKAAEVASKHKDGDANFDDFRAEALNYFTSETVIDEPQRDQSGIVVIGERRDPNQRSMSVGEAFVKSKQFIDASKRRAQGERVASMEFPGVTMLGARGKASMQQRAGWVTSDLAAVNVNIMPGLIALGVQQLTIMDMLPGGAMANGSLVYPRENGFGTVNGVAVPTTNQTSNGPRATMVGEGGLKPNWDPDLTTETASVKKVAVTTKVPDEMMSDFPAMSSFIDARLPYMVDLETEFQLLYGDGLGNNLRGIFTNAGVQTRAIVGTDGTTIAESLKKGLTDIRVGSRFIPTGFAFHPYDWETASLLKDSEGRFLAGGPFYAPFGVGMFVEVNTFWGKPVVVSDSVTYGQPVAGAWNMGAQYFMREGMRIETTNANEDDFRRNFICVRAEHRLALATYRPVAFLEFTGFPARS